MGRTSPATCPAPPLPDHPHARGENDKARSDKAGCDGPSPRAWGERNSSKVNWLPCRTIPTRVGRTPEREIAYRLSPDHPHARGENLSPRALFRVGYGPSPRAWGERIHAVVFHDSDRTIPTRVGRTKSCMVIIRPSTDHPHARGENVFPVQVPEAATGPSPRAWGELWLLHVARHCGRTIPTRVGRTPTAIKCFLAQTDHPHARGENKVAQLGRVTAHGPSPRAWGEPVITPWPMARARTIPTRVGRTVPLPTMLPYWPDHPHARGENFRTRFRFILGRGPSPRAWGEP